MSIDARYDKFIVTNMAQVRQRTRKIENDALSDKVEVWVITFENSMTGKQATFNLLLQDNSVQYHLFDNILNDKSDVYSLVKIALKLEED
jgi:hypothetical protein